MARKQPDDRPGTPDLVVLLRARITIDESGDLDMETLVACEGLEPLTRLIQSGQQAMQQGTFAFEDAIWRALAGRDEPASEPECIASPNPHRAGRA